MNDSPPMVIAHRTCALDAPENSLEGIRRSGELGAGAVELDVRLTRDRVPILMHDPTPHRTAGGRLAVRCTSSVRLQRLRLANGEPVPTLAGALAALPSVLRVAIDVKADRAIDATVTEVCNQNLQARSLIWSRDTSTVRYSADREPTIEPGLLRDARSVYGIARFLPRCTCLWGAGDLGALGGDHTGAGGTRGRAGFEAVLLVPSAPPGPREAPGARRRGDRLADRGSGCDRVAPRRRVTALPARQQYSERHAAFRRSRRVHHAKTLRSSV